MLNFLGQIRDEFVLKVIHQEREEVITVNERTELELTTTPKQSFGIVRGEKSEIVGNVYGHGTREESRQKCIKQAEEIAQNQSQRDALDK